MPRPSVVRAALAGLAALGAVLASTPVPATATPAAHSAPAAPAEEADPLVVHLDAIDPVLPRRGSIEVSGTVTNTSDTAFTRVNMHVFASQAPILESSLLATSASSVPPSATVGERVVVPGTFDTIDTLAPGETASFTDTVPRDLLGVPDEPGVYWIGVHALGDGAVPRDLVADGRARTFVPVLPRGDRTQELSLMIPLRGRVWFDEDGRIGGADRWARRFAEGGSLDAALDTAEAAGDTPYTWLVDPAILLAVAKLAVGNPPRYLDPDPNVPGQEPTPAETPTETPSAAGAVAEAPATDAADEDEALTLAAATWLERFRTRAASDQVLALPFGDLDVSAAVRHAPERYAEAQARSTRVMNDLQVTSRPAVAPEGDRLSPEAIAATPEDTLVLLGDNAFVVPPRTPSSTVRLLGHKVVVSSTGAEAGGPAPTAATDPLALRQRVISEAALRLLDDDAGPVVVTLPSTWRGADAQSFFDGLDQPWLDTVPVTSLEARPASAVNAATLDYDDNEVAAELPVASFTAAQRASDTATLLEQVLALQTTVEQQTEDEVMVTLSEHHRRRPLPARVAATRVGDLLRDDLSSITIEAPTGVTLSGESGQLGATLVNGLDQPVTVGIGVTTDGELTLTGDSERTLGPGARSVVRFKATTSQAGIHRVRLRVVSADGVALGASDEVPIRAARVSALIWFAMVAGGLVLFGMIGYRLPGQIRARRAELRAAEQQEAAVPPESAQPEAAHP